MIDSSSTRGYRCALSLRHRFGFFVCLLCSMIGCNPKVPESTTSTNSTSQKSTTSTTKPDTTSKQSPPVAEQLSFDEKVARADKLLEKGDLEEAWKTAKELMIERPKAPPALFIAARILAKKNDLKGAIQTLSQIDPNDPEAGPAAAGQLAEWLAQIGDLVSAEAKLKGLVKTFPAAIPAHRLLIDIYSAQGRRWESAKHLERLVRLGNFTMTDLVRSIDFREPYDNEPLRKAALRFAPNEPYSVLQEARVFTNRNRWGDALESLASMVKARPELLEPWIWYGEALLETGRIDEMQQWISKRPAGFESHPEYWYIYGSWLTLQKKTKEAARCFVEAIKIDRRHVAAHLGLSVALVELGLVDQAATVRAAAGKLVRINDLIQQIQRGHGNDEELIAIANLYRELDDLVGAFGWDTILLTNAKKPITNELIETQKQLKAGAKKPVPFLKDLPIDDWPLPVDGDYVAIPSSSVQAESNYGESPIRISDVALQLGLVASYNNGAVPNRGWYILEGMGGGVTVIDFDRDGWPEFYFSNAGDVPTKAAPLYLPKKLFRSVDGQRFIDVQIVSHTEDVGYGQGVGTADIDQDGFADLLIANVAEITWYRNQGDGTFERMELPQAPPPSYWNSGIQAADLNGDALPDIVQCVYIDGDDAFTRWCQNTNSPRGNCHPKRFVPGKSRILFNQGDGSWKLADQELLDSLVDGYAFGSLICNIDQREGNDVFFANDVSPNHLLLSRMTGSGVRQLVECAASAGVAVDASGRAQACMGIAVGDQNRDGMLDIIVTNYRNEVSTLYLQTSPGIFVDGTRNSNLGTHTLDWLSFGAQLADLDNDGWLDFTALNGHIDDLTLEGVPWKMPPQVMKNERGRFNWLRKPSPGAYWDVENVGRSLQMVDFNRDGRVDFAATHLDRPAGLLCNQTVVGPNRFIQFEILGTRSERNAIGAILHLQSGNEKWVAPVAVGDGFYGTSEHLVHLGVGPVQRIDHLQVVWPTGESESFTDLETNHRYTIIERVGISEQKLSPSSN